MQGTLIALSGRTNATVCQQNKIYQLKLSADLATQALPGSTVEYDLSSGTITAFIEKPQVNNIALSCDLTVPEHQILSRDGSYQLCAEGHSFKECYKNLASCATAHHINALLNLKGEYVKRPFARHLVFRLCAEGAQISGPQYNPDPGYKLTLPLKLLRRNSPSQAQKRYHIVLLVCLLLIVEPCLSALMQRQILPELVAYIRMGALPMLCLLGAIFDNPCRSTVYLKQVRH